MYFAKLHINRCHIIYSKTVIIIIIKYTSE